MLPKHELLLYYHSCVERLLRLFMLFSFLELRKICVSVRLLPFFESTVWVQLTTVVLFAEILVGAVCCCPVFHHSSCECWGSASSLSFHLLLFCFVFCDEREQ